MDNPTPDNPYEPPRPDEAPITDLGEIGEPSAEMEVVDVLANKRQWTLRVFPQLLRFDASNEQNSVEVSRRDLPEKTTIHDSLLMRRCVEVKTDKKRVFQLSRDDFAALLGWIGPPTHRDLVAALKKRFVWVLPIAVVFVLTAMPFSGDPAAGMDPIAFDPLWFGLGISLLAVGVVSRFVPHRIFFLVDSLWFLILVGAALYDIAFTGASWLWFAIVPLQISLVVGGVKQYRRFHAVSPRSTNRL